MDGRRRQWIAFDALFFTDDLCHDLLDRFGTAGVVVFSAYLCACKRNATQGRITVSNDADTLAVLGLPGLPLVDIDGEPWELDALWTYLGRMKQVKRTRRGRVTDVISTRWERWQNPPGTRPERKGKPSSGGINTPDNPENWGPDTAPDSDNDNDNDIDTRDADALLPPGLWSSLARRRMTKTESTIVNPTAWLATTAASAERDHAAEAAQLVLDYPEITEAQLMDAIDGNTSVLRFLAKRESA